MNSRQMIDIQRCLDALANESVTDADSAGPLDICPYCTASRSGYLPRRGKQQPFEHDPDCIVHTARRLMDELAAKAVAS